MNTVHRGFLMAMIAAMKKVLSPNSETMMTLKVAINPWKKLPEAPMKPSLFFEFAGWSSCISKGAWSPDAACFSNSGSTGATSEKHNDTRQESVKIEIIIFDRRDMMITGYLNRACGKLTSVWLTALYNWTMDYYHLWNWTRFGEKTLLLLCFFEYWFRRSFHILVNWHKIQEDPAAEDV